jgi:superfamily II DNA helicase RecQ
MSRRRTQQDGVLAYDSLVSMLDITHFRDHQLTLILALVIDRKDVWAQLPCGLGKTLIFAACVLLHCVDGEGSIGLLIEPLESIIRDATEAFEKLGIIVLELTEETCRDVCTFLKEGRPSNPTIIIGKPKQMVKRSFIKAISFAQRNTNDKWTHDTMPTSPIDVLGYDEVHCGLWWGVSFLRSWSKIGRLTEALNTWPGLRCPMIAMTATANNEVMRYVQALIGFDHNFCHIERCSIFRPHVTWHFHIENEPTGGPNIKDKRTKLTTLLVAQNVVIIFVNTRNAADRLADALNRKLVVSDDGSKCRAASYHAGCPETLKHEHEKDFQKAAVNAYRRRQLGTILTDEKELRVLVCTIAFGMGVNKAYADCVMIWETPWCITNMIQQGFRAGRAQTAAVVHVYACHSEVVQNALNAVEDGKKAASEQHTRGRTHARTRELLAESLRREQECYRVYKLFLTTCTCRYKQMDNALDIPTTVPCHTRCDVCLSNETEVEMLDQDWLACDILIAAMFKERANQGVAATEATRNIASDLPGTFPQRIVRRRIEILHVKENVLKAKRNEGSGVVNGSGSGWVLVQGTNWPSFVDRVEAAHAAAQVPEVIEQAGLEGAEGQETLINDADNEQQDLDADELFGGLD